MRLFMFAILLAMALAAITFYPKTCPAFICGGTCYSDAICGPGCFCAKKTFGAPVGTCAGK